MTYSNSFHNPLNRDSKPEIICESKPVEYKGHLIFERIKGVCYDVVKDGVCIGMRAGISGAKRFIDKLTNQNIA